MSETRGVNEAQPRAFFLLAAARVSDIGKVGVRGGDTTTTNRTKAQVTRTWDKRAAHTSESTGSNPPVGTASGG